MRFVPHFLPILVLVCVQGLASAQEPQLELFLQLGHTNGITSVALSGDGKHVVTSSVDRTAILWDAASGNKLQTFQGNHVISCVALSGDGKRSGTRPRARNAAGSTASMAARTGWSSRPRGSSTVPKGPGGSSPIASQAS